MSYSKRLHRDDPVRTGPIRNFSGLYQSNYSDGHSSNSSSSASSKNGAPADGRERSQDEGIGLAYRVIEKHIRDGKKNAERFNDQPYNARPITDGFPELLERTIRYQNELLPLWLQALGSAVRIDSLRMPNTPGPFTRPESNNPASHGSKAISLEIASARPVQVSLDLREHSEALPLISLGLRAVDENKPPLNDISFAPATTRGAIRLRISVPDSHPPGTYSGVIVNRDSGETLGTLSISIAE